MFPAYSEHKGIAADFQQLQQIHGGRNVMKQICETSEIVPLTVVHRTSDPLLLQYLAAVRTAQPTKRYLENAWQSKVWRPDLKKRVRQSSAIAETIGKPFTWLTVTNKGASEVNSAAIAIWMLSQ